MEYQRNLMRDHREISDREITEKFQIGRSQRNLVREITEKFSQEDHREIHYYM